MFEGPKNRFRMGIGPANDLTQDIVAPTRPVDIELSNYIVEMVVSLIELAVKAGDEDLATRLNMVVSNRKTPLI